MFEGAIAAFLNRLLGRYVEDLDTEQFNVGIFSGDTCLTDLKLKPEALVRWNYICTLAVVGKVNLYRVQIYALPVYVVLLLAVSVGIAH